MACWPSSCVRPTTRHAPEAMSRARLAGPKMAPGRPSSDIEAAGRPACEAASGVSRNAAWPRAARLAAGAARLAGAARELGDALGYRAGGAQGHVRGGDAP